MEKIYVQTASFSRQLREDFEGSLKKISASGYTGVELFDAIHGGYDPQGLCGFLGELDLEIIGSHVKIEDTDGQLEYLSRTECKYIVCPGIQVGSESEAYDATKLLNELGKKAVAYGMKYGYHNHNSDFDRYGDKTVIDIFIENTDPELVFFELDAGWAWRAGIDAAEFITKYSGRFELIHVKETSRKLTPEDDMTKLFEKFGIKREKGVRPQLPPELAAIMQERQKINCKLGDGIIDVPSFVKAGDAQGTKAYIVEREYAYTGDIFTSLDEDCQYMRTI